MEGRRLYQLAIRSYRARGIAIFADRFISPGIRQLHGRSEAQRVQQIYGSSMQEAQTTRPVSYNIMTNVPE